MTNEERAELARLAEAATPGPWESRPHDDDDYPTYDVYAEAMWSQIERFVADDLAPADAAFIAAARTAVPALLDENAALRAVLFDLVDGAAPLYGTQLSGRWECPHCRATLDYSTGVLAHNTVIDNEIVDFIHDADCPVTRARALLAD